MKIVKDDVHRLLEPFTTLMFLGEDMLSRIVEDPAQSLLESNEKGFSYEEQDMYDTNISLLDICREGQKMGAKRIDVSYDFFFGGDKRENYPDSPLTLKAYKVIHDLAREHGMEFCASVVSPLDTGGGYAKTHENPGRTMQFKEIPIREDGFYETVMDFQTQWTNNKGPMKLKLREVKAFAFDEERIGDTPYYYVNEEEIEEISDTVRYEIDQASLRVSKEGYGHGDIHIAGRTSCGKHRCLAVVVYDTLEVDYFAEDALDYMKSIIDLHAAEGITYAGVYADEMHIQYDWDRIEHFGETEVTTRYMTDAFAHAYAEKYGKQYEDFAKYLVYFTYQHHDFIEGEEGMLPAQHVFGRTREDIVRTWQFRKHYYEMLHRQVVNLCNETKEYAAELFGHFIISTGHTTWEESPTCDCFFKSEDYEDPYETEHSLYDYTPEFVWSAASRENISACNDHFKWNEFLCAVGTDIPEGGFLDRNYYGAAYTSSLAALNIMEYAYYCIWGSPDPIKELQAELGYTYGHYSNYCKSFEFGHNLVQGMTTRISNVLTLCPMDLNYVEERYGNWMVQYGYTDYITEEKLLENVKEPVDAALQVGNRSYRALVVSYSPLMSVETLQLLKAYVEKGGKVVWCSAPAQEAEVQDLALETEGQEAVPQAEIHALELWKELFGVQELAFGLEGECAGGQKVHFGGMCTVKDMPILTDLFPDRIYPVVPGEGKAIATLGEKILGTLKEYPGGGKAVYLGFRVRDDQSGSTGEDVDTLFSVLRELGCYEEKGCEISSRPAESRYIYNRFPNGSVTLCNHMRSLREQGWQRTFYRDEEKDQEFMKHLTIPSREVHLEEMELLGHRVTYEGMGALTYRYDPQEGLLGLVGSDTCGICIDGQEYRFTEEPVNLVWGRLDRKVLKDEIKEAYVLKCSRSVRIKLPMDAAGMACGLCANHVLDVIRDYPFTTENGETYIEISEAAAGQWMVLYR